MIRFSTHRIPDFISVIRLYEDAGLVRPVTDVKRIVAMYNDSNLIVTAWQNDLLVGVARSVTDFAYCCYLCDLAVLKSFQKRGIGKRLIEITKEKAGEGSMLLLLSTPGTMEYYSKINMEKAENAFIIHRAT
ncbi:MAG: GNAT family N-acetyltransferase [Crocinitomicaceae bacterium]|nr:GNAT family N-acetyltransferase [Crocinitomicaceae bacterium]